MEDREPTVRGRELGNGLRDAMVAAGYNGKQLAAHLGWAQSRVSRLLSGKRIAREVDVAAFLAVCGIAGLPRERLLTLCRQESMSNPLEVHGARLPMSLGRAADYESDARRIVCFACVTIPVLLRAARYARALAVASPLVSPDSVDDAVAAMLVRSEVLSRPIPPECLFLIHESVLRAPAGGSAIMSEQLHHMLRMSAWPMVTIRVVPSAAGAHAAPAGSFTVLESVEYQSVVYREEEHSDVFLEGSDKVADYRRIAARLGEMALDASASRDLIAKLAASPDASWSD